MTSTKKTKKPLIEKQRRERMNKSLVQIKQLVLQATNKNEMNYMKMEKADILEMTVTFLKSLQKSQNPLRHPSVSPTTTTTFLHTFQEPTSTTLLAEDSPAREAATKPTSSQFQSGSNSPPSSFSSSSSSSSSTSVSNSSSPSASRKGPIRSCESETNHRLQADAQLQKSRDLRPFPSSKDLDVLAFPPWRPW